MRRATLVAVTFVFGCISPEYKKFWEQQEKFASNGADSSGDVETTSDGGATSTGSIGSNGSAGSSGDTSDGVDAAPLSTGDATDTGDSGDDPPVGDADKPEIVEVDLPAKVHAAGPVPLAVQTRHVEAVHVMFDGADLGELIAAGDGLFTGSLPVHGAVDDGWHAVEVRGKQGSHEVSHVTGFTVETPEPGTEAWSLAGPDGSRTNRIVVTPEGDSIEVGQTEIGGVPVPTIRKRSVANGVELWPEGTITLDVREGAAVDVAVLPDGRMWVAMNVRPPGKDPRPRIALLGADGHPLGIEVEGTPGRVVRGLAADAEGGCFAVGLAGVMGDWDIAYWRIDAAGVQTIGDTFDYVPSVDMQLPHSFSDLASDVVIDGDVAWIAGMSKGAHDEVQGPIAYLRGILVPMNIHTGKLADSVSVAPPADGWPHSAFYGAAMHPEGVLVTGYRCDKTCSKYQIETSRYGLDGTPSWSAHEATTDGLAYGSDVVLDSQGRALVAGAVTQSGKLRGHVFARYVDAIGLPVIFDHWYPGIGPSEALGIAVDGFDRIFSAGYITVNGEAQAWITRIHG